ncbi:MAG: shikimate kinase, partial [Deltaproteobacteria bacterium]|nr:shikimate kinase [Deltaproteobacteria bacterium]
APGGGALEDPENREILKQNGLLVWLTADLETIVERMCSDRKGRGQRPSLTGEDPTAEAAEMIHKREPVYRRLADLTIDTSHRGIGSVTDAICDFLERERICRETPSERCSG